LSIKVNGSKLDHMTCSPRRVPEPKSSLIEPRIKRDMVKPRPIPKPSAMDRIGLFLDAKASALPRIIQFTTIKGMKIPKTLKRR
jgi:hypothetical protein